MIPMSRPRHRKRAAKSRRSVIEPAPFDDEARFEMLMLKVGKALQRFEKEVIFVPWGNGWQLRMTLEFQREAKA